MRELFIPGSYCDCSPDGEFAALVFDSHIETSRGRVPLCPAGNVLYLRMDTTHGRLMIAGRGSGQARSG
jgi:hypothetical protein